MLSPILGRLGFFTNVCIAAITIMVFSSVAAMAANEPLIAYAARIAGDDARTRIVIDFDHKPDFAIHYVGRPNRVVVDLSETEFGFKDTDLEPRGLFSAIRYGRMGEGSSRIVLRAKRPLKVSRAEVIENEPGKGYRLVIDSEIAPEEAFAELIRQQKWSGAEKAGEGKADRIGPSIPKPDNIFLVAVDAGHGGIDAGASGQVTKVEEKTVTLEFARALADQLNRQPGIRAFLVRDKDVFISLSERVTIARQQGANLFISLHADTLRQKDIRGATVYTISDKASDSLAADLAARENLSDDIGGVELKSEPEEVTDILVDFTRRETLAFSVKLAESVVSSFEGQIKLINNPHRHAGFRVLQAPDVPSVLLELGFLSNKEDEKQLLDPEWRAKVTERIAKAVQAFRSPDLAKGG